MNFLDSDSPSLLSQRLLDLGLLGELCLLGATGIDSERI